MHIYDDLPLFTIIYRRSIGSLAINQLSCLRGSQHSPCPAFAFGGMVAGRHSVYVWPISACICVYMHPWM